MKQTKYEGGPPLPKTLSLWSGDFVQSDLV